MREVSHMVVRPAACAVRPVARAPRLSAALCDMLREVEIVDEFGERRRLDVPAERPLTIFVDGRELVTLTTLGASPELLVLGYLHNQRLIRDVSEIESIEVDWNLAAAHVKSRSGERFIAAGSTVPMPSVGCGLGTVFGEWVSQSDAIRLPATKTARIGQRLLYRVLEMMSEQESLHRGAGSVHGCALFRAAEMLVFVEDVGRHNAIDTLIGWMALHGVAGGDKIFYTTGRLSAEMVIKAAQIGVPIMVSRNGATAMGLDVAARLGMTLVGRAVKRRFLCYVGVERFDAEPEPRTATDGVVEK
ncbi:MAG: formate dehydrogenase accessory sulfurtransferase FdhD [Steroidobacteraceae bacterium]